VIQNGNSTKDGADLPSRHLDLGCGGTPRNPYRQSQVFGVDIAPNITAEGVEIRKGNLALDPIPFPENHFSSVSAYDFLEHVPRILPTLDMRGTRFPFIELMNEVWRVLKPGGLFYAQTPAFPHQAAFQDPTHVNVITKHSHIYFTRPQLMAKMYGYHGDFELIRRVRVIPKFEWEPIKPSWRRRLRNLSRTPSHLIWEFRALK